MESKASKQEKRARKHPHPAAVNAALTLSYRSQKAFILVIPRREELQHFIRLHLSAERNGFKQQCLAHQLEDGIGFFFFFRLSSPLSVISLLPCVSLQLFEETQEVCRNVPPQFAVYTARRTAHRPTQHSYDARYEKKKTLRACIHLSTHCHIWGFSITQF